MKKIARQVVIIIQILCIIFFENTARCQIITTVAGGTGHGGGWGDGGMATAAEIGAADVAVDLYGNIYIPEYKKIRKVDVKTGIITTVAGTGVAGYNGDGIQATDAQLGGAAAVNVDVIGNFYISDIDNYRIRKVDISTGLISTIAGNGVQGFSGDGNLATMAKITVAAPIAWDPFGNMYFSDTSRIRKIDKSGIISTIAGNGIAGCMTDGVPATNSNISKYGVYIATDISGNIYLSSFDTCVTVEKINVVTGIISRIGGTNDLIGTPYSGDGSQATLCHISPLGITVDNKGYIYIADATNQRIEQIDPFGIIRTVAGTGSHGFSGDNGLATLAELSYPEGVSVDGCGNLYIADFNNNRIRKVTFDTSCNPATLKAGCIAREAPLAIYPNPTIDALHIDNIAQQAGYRIVSMVSAVVQTGPLRAGDNSIDVRGLPQGVYMVEVSNADGGRVIRKFVKE